jgi:hypothetical protein
MRPSPLHTPALSYPQRPPLSPPPTPAQPLTQRAAMPPLRACTPPAPAGCSTCPMAHSSTTRAWSVLRSRCSTSNYM